MHRRCTDITDRDRPRVVTLVAQLGERDATINHLRASLDHSSLQVAEAHSALEGTCPRLGGPTCKSLLWLVPLFLTTTSVATIGIAEQREQYASLQRRLEAKTVEFTHAKADIEQQHKVQVESLCGIVTGLRGEVIDAQEQAAAAEEQRAAALDELEQSRAVRAPLARWLTLGATSRITNLTLFTHVFPLCGMDE